MTMRNTSGGFYPGGFTITPAVKMLLIANVVIFVLQLLTRSSGASYNLIIDRWFGFVPALAIYKFQIWRFITYMFLHADFGHILWNMFGVWMFGTHIESLWGKRSFLLFYGLCGLGGAVLYGVFNLSVPGSMSNVVGASGALFGILVAFGMTFPNMILRLAFIFPVKAKWVVIGYGIFELLSLQKSNGIANLAHLGGMITGFLFIWFAVPNVGRSLGGAENLRGAWHRFQTKRKMRVVRPNKPKGNGGPSASSPNDAKKSPQQKQIDVILDKISKEGLQALTDEEQEILRRAGRK